MSKGARLQIEFMKMNRTLAYGLACLHHLSDKGKDGAWVAVKDIAGPEKLPPAYCNKVLQALVHVGLVRSSRGRGFRLAKPINKISVWEVMEAFTFNGAPKKDRQELSFLLYGSLRDQVNRWLVGLTLEDIVESVRKDNGVENGGVSEDSKK